VGGGGAAPDSIENPQTPDRLGTRQKSSRRVPILPGCKSHRKIPSDYLLPADSFDSLYGEFRSNTRTRWRPEGGTPTTPPKTISLEVSLRP
jgi:hypothetical protein